MANTSKPSGKKNVSGKLLWIIPVVALVLGFVAFFAYNKYLDRQNVAEMEQLLADFEQLKTDAETETGEKFYILSTCESVGKFAGSYKCGLYLNSNEQNFSNYSNLKSYGALANKEKFRCITIKSVDASEYNSLSCTIAVRDENRDKAEEIYYDYDTSPGSPF